MNVKVKIDRTVAPQNAETEPVISSLIERWGVFSRFKRDHTSIARRRDGCSTLRSEELAFSYRDTRGATPFYF